MLIKTALRRIKNHLQPPKPLPLGSSEFSAGLMFERRWGFEMSMVSLQAEFVPDKYDVVTEVWEY